MVIPEESTNLKDANIRQARLRGKGQSAFVAIVDGPKGGPTRAQGLAVPSETGVNVRSQDFLDNRRSGGARGRGPAQITRKTASKMRVRTTDMTREPRQPRRLEKKKNTEIGSFGTVTTHGPDGASGQPS